MKLGERNGKESEEKHLLQNYVESHMEMLQGLHHCIRCRSGTSSKAEVSCIIFCAADMISGLHLKQL